MSETSAGVAQSRWKSGRFRGENRKPTLLFGRMFEDSAIERRVLPQTGQVFCIASAGCTAFDLVRHGSRVTAVDVNSSQIAYVERRLKGGGCERGSADRIMTILRRAAACCGLRAKLLGEFLVMDDPNEQLRFWQGHVDRPALRRATRVMLSRHLLRLAYSSPLVRALPESFADVLWRRLERGIRTHPNRTNPYAWQLFVGNCPNERSVPVSPSSIELACADAAAYLAKCSAGIFRGLTLSNILDGVGADYASRLFRAMRHSAGERTPVVIRSFAEPRHRDEEELAAADRSMLWGRIVVRPVEDISEAFLR